MNDSITKTLRTGWVLLALALPLGVTLEALHGFKVQVYLASEMRREMWRLAHAHGTLLGVVCLVFCALADRYVARAIRDSVARQIRWGAVLMPLGFFLGGILNGEGDPSLGIVLVPVGAALLIVALLRCAWIRPDQVESGGAPSSEAPRRKKGKRSAS
jgi:hypothetical protein